MGPKDRLPDRSTESKEPAGGTSAVEKDPVEREHSTFAVSNEFLNREISRLESERDALIRELQYVTAGYSWKLIGGYRRWLENYRESALVRLCESLTLWSLRRIFGGEESDPQKLYLRWIGHNELTPELLDAIAAATTAFPYRPLISIYILMRDTAANDFLTAAIDSVRAQLYDKWEVCIVCAAGDSRVRDNPDRYSRGDVRVSTKSAPEGEFVVFMEPDAELSRDALFELVQQLNRNRNADLIYWDEDRVDANGTRRAPFFKPDWSPDLILSMNYVGQSFAVRKSLIDLVSGIGSELFDLILRTSEHARAVIHISKILVHRRNANERKQEKRPIEDALRRRGVHADVVASRDGRNFVRYEISDHPMVSILIPTKDKRELLQQCIDSVLKKTDYANYEIIILDNDSREPDTLSYFQQIADKATVVSCPGSFNYSAINNRGVTQARGELLLFLNNDTEVISSEWMRAMIEQAQRPEVGAVGAKLLFRDGRIQHAGIVLGIEGLVAHAFQRLPGNGPECPEFADVIRDCSAVTGACLMTRRSLFEELGGFDESLPIDYNDVDLCLRMRRRDYLIVYTPLAVLYHLEGATRRKLSYESQREVFLRKWGKKLATGDPYYNRNLTLSRADWSIAV